MKRTLKFALGTLLALFAYSGVSAQDPEDIAWPPTPETKELFKQKIEIIKGLPDEAFENSNSGQMFSDPVAVDERNIYVIKGYVWGFEIMTTLAGPEDENVRNAPRKPFADLYIINTDGETVATVSSGRWSTAYISPSDESLKLPDGVYRIRPSYGKRHDRNGTKPNQLIGIRVRAHTAK